VLKRGEENATGKYSAAYSRPELMDRHEWYYTREHIEVMIHNQD